MSMKIGVYVCECGPNIADKVDIDSIIKEIPSLEEFEAVELVIKRYKLLCSIEGQQFLVDEIKSQELTHLVVAACSPRDHEATFMNVCKQANLNPYLFQMVNIREQCAWIISDREEATKKAVRSIRAGIRRAIRQSELMEKQLDSTPDVLVIGGGIAGMETALRLAGTERKVYLVEKTEKLGGQSAHYSRLLPRQGGDAESIQRKIQQVEQHDQIQVFLETELESVVGFFGNFELVLTSKKETSDKTELKVGAIVVATGFQLLDPKILPKYQYEKKDDVYDTQEIESMISAQGKLTLNSGETPQSVAMVHCVGREEKGYCSSICCSTLIKLAQQIKALLPDAAITSYYRDLCLPHKADQAYFEEIKAQGVHFVRVKDVGVQNTRITYTERDGSKKQGSPDMVVLAPAMEPAEGNNDLAVLLNIHQDEFGFFRETHHHLNPVATSTEGIYIVGASHGPMGISDSINQAQAASGKILTRLIPGEKIIPEVKVSEILEAFCTGCRTCLDICCYGAIFFNEEKNISVVNEAVCRGCGNCVAGCPSGAIRAKHFTGSQLYQEMIEAIR